MRFRIALLTLGLATWGYAQTLAADIPFQFHVGDQSYAPGRYIVSPGVSSADPNIMWALRSRDTGKTIMFHTSTVLPARTSKAPRLVFNKYARAYFLSEVWGADGRRGLQLPATNRERELAKSTLEGDVVTVALGH